jgi:hypothetical protein
MNAIVLAAAMLALGMQEVETTPQAKTQLYVKTVPTGAAISLGGQALGKSDGLFDVAAGVHQLVVRLEGYVPEERSVNVKEGEITRVEVRLKKHSARLLPFFRPLSGLGEGI